MKYINPKSISLIKYKDFIPKIDESVFVADGVRIIGDVEILGNSSIWFNTVIRGDVNCVKIGPECNIQDNSCLHVEHAKFALEIEQGVTVGHSVTLHGCFIGHHSLIGMGATVMNGAHIGAESIVGAGALVPEGMQIPPRTIVIGCPARIKRSLTGEEVESLYESAKHYVNYARSYSESLFLDIEAE